MKKKHPVKDKTGLPPGTLVHIGEKFTESISIEMIDYGLGHFKKADKIDLAGLYPFLAKPESKTWVRISGLHEAETIAEFGNKLGIHPLVLEDIMNTNQRIKIEAYDDYLYIVVKSLSNYNNISTEEPYLHQVSIILSPGYILSFHEQKEDVFDIIPPRINIPGGRFEKFGVDYLLYSILDIVVDQYFVYIDKINDEIMEIERSILDNEIKSGYNRLHELRRNLIYLRGKISPMTETLQTIIREDHPLISQETTVYFRDVLDHLRRVIDSLQHSEEIVLGLFDMYMTQINFRTGEIMKVLTIIATIFIPLTFIAGIYGMNFDTKISPFNMPELRWYFGYPAVMFFMFFASMGMLYYFRKKKWL